MSLPNKSVDLKFSANDAFLEKPSSGTLTIQRLTRFWRSLHQVRSQSKDWRVSGEAFIRYAHNPKTDAFLE